MADDEFYDDDVTSGPLPSSGWISVGTFCRTCRHENSVHEGAGTECSYGWSDDPALRDESPPCDCERFVFGGHNVAPARR